MTYDRCPEYQASTPRLTVAADAWQACEALTRKHGRTFFLASRFLPPERRRGTLATYAFCRTADDIVDATPVSDPVASAAALDRWEAQLTSPNDPIARAFAWTRAQFSVPLQPAHDLIAGIRMDLAPRQYASWEELRAYCYLVAGTVGLMIAPILGCRDPRALICAAELGIAMQLTNILRDVGEDARLGRLYLPLDEIESFGCDPEGILAGRAGNRFSDLMSFQIDRARQLYASAHQGLGALPPHSRFTTLVASDLYARILSEIEACGYDVFRYRAHVSPGRKLCALPRIAATIVRCPSMTAGAEYEGTVMETGSAEFEPSAGGDWYG